MEDIMLIKYIMEHKVNEHFSEPYAKYVVSKMCHYEDNRKYSGEKFSLEKAKEICENYKDRVSSHIHYIELYIALNCHYHDYIKLYKKWFNEEAEDKIVEAVVEYWSNDDISLQKMKMWDYYKDI